MTGDPENFAGLNIQSDGERLGPEPKGEKASGRLMVNGVLYILIRNADRAGATSRLGWSTDHAKSWTWADWSFDKLGHPAFINYGKNYQGARDEFVYTISHDHPSAYETSDHFVLLRVPTNAIRDQSCYEYFVEIDGEEAEWSADPAARGSVFTNLDQCRRSPISYNPGIGRYLWWQQLSMGDSDTRFDGGFGLYDAPEPWGPLVHCLLHGSLGCWSRRSWPSPHKVDERRR